MKLGLVLEGGASRTAFSCGVLDFLLEQNIMADYLIGVSAGISYGVSYASRQKGRNMELNHRFLPDRRYMGLRHLLNPRNKSFYNTKFVFEEVPNLHLPFDFQAFAAFPGTVIGVVTNIETGKAEYLEVPRDDKTFRVLQASCSLPFLFKPVLLNGKLYMDGGLSDSIPYKQALKEGCDKLIVLLTRERGYRKELDPTFKLAKRVYKDYPKLVEALEHRHEVYNACIDELHQLEQQGRVFLIMPDSTHGIKRTEHNPQILDNFYQEGYDKAVSLDAQLKAYLSN